MNIVASDKEYLDWFYHTVRVSSGIPEFERKMADKFKSERGLICPFYIPKVEVKSDSVTSASE